MTTTDYRAIFESEFKKLGELIQSRDAIELQISKSKQLIFATLNMLPDAEREEFQEKLASFADDYDKYSCGLKDSVLKVLESAYPKTLTARMVRDRLTESGFDFSQYTANPLASVSTTLRRFKSTDVESTDTEGVTTFRLKAAYAQQRRKMRRGRRVSVLDKAFWNMYGEQNQELKETQKRIAAIAKVTGSEGFKMALRDLKPPERK